MEELRTLRVEPDGQPQRIGVVEVVGRALLDEPGGRGHVVPGGVATEHALVQVELRREAPLGDDPGGDADRYQECPAGNGRRGDFLYITTGEAVPDTGCGEGDEYAAGDDPAEREDRESAEQLERKKQERDRDRDLGEPREGTREFGHDPAPEPVSAQPQGQGDTQNGGGSDYVAGEGRGHARPLRSRSTG